jgi:carboxymethylenebutenolidase
MASMAAMHAGDTPAPSPVAVVPPRMPVQGADVVYASIDGKPVHGYLSRPAAAKGPLPGIIVIHEWWGLNDNIRHATDRLAGEGYAALAVDLYGGQAGATPDEATKLMTAAMAHTDLVQSNLRQAYAYLHEHEQAPRLAVLGWCFGGGWSLQTALLFPDQLDGVIMYYGKPVTDVAALAKLKMPLIGFFGAEDKGITVDMVQAFEAALKQAKVDEEIHIYPHAGHAFANPSGQNYQPEAAQDSWQRTVQFLSRHLGGG